MRYPKLKLGENERLSTSYDNLKRIEHTTISKIMADPVKNRIVINLDQPGAASPRVTSRSDQRGRRRRWPKVLAILVALVFVFVLVAAAGVFFWWRHYQTTPAYSLALIIDAAQRNDMAAFNNQLDNDAIAKNLLVNVRQKAGSRYGIVLNDSLQQKIDNMLPSLLPELKDRTNTEVAKEIKEFSARAESKPFLLVALAVSSVATISTQGDNARAIAAIPDRTIELALRRDGDRWKVVDFKDDVVIERVVDSVMKDLPAIGSLDLKLPFLKQTKPRRRNR